MNISDVAIFSTGVLGGCCELPKCVPGFSIAVMLVVAIRIKWLK